jgi:O-antigen/teichoic acid export membrane protein
MTAPRRRALTLSYATAGLSKAVAAAVQLVALPIVAGSLGANGFGALMAMGALAAIFCIPARGIPASLSLRVGQARGAGDIDKIPVEVRAAVIAALIFGAAVVLLTIGLFSYVDTWRLVGADDENQLKLQGAGTALVVFLIATYGFSWVEGLRTGHEQHHLNNLFSLAGSLLALVSIGLAWSFAPTVVGYFYAIYVTYPAVHLINALLARRQLSGGHALNLRMIREISAQALEWSVAQAGVVFSLQGTVWIASHTAGLAIGGLVGGVVRLFQILHNLFLAILTPILPTLSHSVAARDTDWSIGTLRRTSVLIVGVLGVIGLGIVLFGEQLTGSWLGLNIASQPGLFGGFGLLVIAYMTPQLFYLLLMAIGAGRSASRNLLFGSLVGTACGILAAQFFGVAGLVWAQAFGMLVGAAVPNAQLVFNRVRFLMNESDHMPRQLSGR